MFVPFQALVDFKKEKISRQNARLSLANSAYENPSMPYRKILLQTGSANYRPPVERGKAAPKLKVIEEAILEEEEEEEATAATVESSSPTAEISAQHHRELRHFDQMSTFYDSETELISTTSDYSMSIDTISLATTMSTLDDAAVGNLVVISDNPRAEKISVCQRQNAENVDSSDDDDLVTDYLTKLRVDIDSATASLSPESGRQFGRLSHSSRSSSTSTSSRKTVEELDEEDEHSKIPEAAKARNPEEHQDTISDESGYSEDSSPSGKEERLGMMEHDVSPPTLEDCMPSPPLDGLLVEDCDLSVKGVMISDFSTAERFRYLQRSRRNVQKARADFLQNKVTEFCINI